MGKKGKKAKEVEPTPELTGENSKNEPLRDDNGKLLPGGPSLNPSGRPKGSVSITEAIKRKLEETYPGEDNTEKKTYLEKIIDAIMTNALEHKHERTLKDIWSYIDGLPKGTMAIDVDKENLKELTDFFRVVGNPKKDGESKS